MATLSRRGWLFIAAALSLTCCDPLVDQTYRGEPLFTMEGQLFGSSQYVDLGHPVLRVVVFWSPDGPTQDDFDHYVEQPAAGESVTVPMSWVIHIFEKPSADMFYTASTGDQYAIGRVLAYVDKNGNGQRDADEPIVGRDPARALLYAPAELSADVSPIGAATPAGFHVLRLPLTCGANHPPSSGTEDCGIPLGAECEKDSDCKGGTCIRQFQMPWPRGACGERYIPASDQCRPKGSVLVRDKDPNTGYWVRSCQTDADCGRDFPYMCDLSTGACLPIGNWFLEVTDDTTTAISICLAADMGRNADGGMPPPPDGGMPPPDGGMPPPLPDGGRPPPPSDGGMPPPLPDGGLPPPPPDGGMPPPMMDGGMPPPPPDGGFPPPPPDGGMPPPLPDGGRPPPPPDGGLPPPLPDGGRPPPPPP